MGRNVLFGAGVTASSRPSAIRVKLAPMAIANPSVPQAGSHENARVAFAPPSARRLLALGGIGLILIGMIFGDIFAVFVLHQNAARVGASLSAAAHAALMGDVRT